MSDTALFVGSAGIMPALSTEPELVVVDSQGLVIRNLGRKPYIQVWQAMQKYTDERTERSPDELWFVEHDPVFTQGQAGKAEHLLMPGDIPVVQVDRGGQVTYHGPGQLVAYVLLDIKRRKLGVRELVTLIEQVIIKSLAPYGIEAYAKADAPGVYVQEQKVASLGLRVRKGCTFHGLALNVNMDLSPFSRINPCGYAGMQMIQTKDIAGPQSVDEARQALQSQFVAQLAVSQIEHKTGLSE